MKASGYARAAHSWYVEPAWGIERLLDAEKIVPGTRCLDPSCGEGRIPRALRARGIECDASDIVDRGYGRVRDFWTYPAEPIVDVVITNPPFGATQDYVRHALAMATNRVIILERLAFLEGQARDEFYRDVPFARLWVSRKRMSMPPGGTDIKARGGTVAYAWFVFQHGHVGPYSGGWI